MTFGESFAAIVCSLIAFVFLYWYFWCAFQFYKKGFNIYRFAYEQRDSSSFFFVVNLLLIIILGALGLSYLTNL